MHCKEGHLFVSPTGSTEASDHASYWKRGICPHPQGGNGLMVGKGPHRLPRAHFHDLPSTLSLMKGGSPRAPSPVSGLSGRSPQGPASWLSPCTAHSANPGRFWTCPHPAPPPNSSSVPRTLCPLLAMDRASLVLRLILEGPHHLPALNLASPPAPRVGLSSLPLTMPLGLQGNPPSPCNFSPKPPSQVSRVHQPSLPCRSPLIFQVTDPNSLRFRLSAHCCW